MALLRLSIKDGIAVTGASDLDKFVRDLARDRIEDFVLLTPGTYNLTPTCWEKNLYNHTLTVHPNGFGTYTLVPKVQGAGTVEMSRDGISELKEGKREFRIPEDGPISTVAGPLKDRITFGIYEVIIYARGSYLVR